MTDDNKDTFSSGILITGGLGAIGSYVVRNFVNEGFKPVVLDQRDDFSLVRDIEGQFDFVKGDVTNEELLSEIVSKKRISCIVHFSSVLGPVCNSDPKLAWHVNVDGTLNILETSRKKGVRRVLYASSKSALGHFVGKHGYPDYMPVNEAYPFNPSSFYGATKVASEVLGKEYRRNYGIEFCAFRFASTYGPGKMTRHSNASGISRIIEAGILGHEYELERGGDQLNDYVYNSDIGRAVVLGYRSKTLSTEYNIGSGKLHTPRDVANVVLGFHPDAQLKIGEGKADVENAGELSYGLLDIKRAKAELGYEPKFSLKDGIADYETTVKRLKLDHSI